MRNQKSEIFLDRRGGGVVELGHFGKQFVKSSKAQEKEAPQETNVEFFLLDTLKTTF